MEKRSFPSYPLMASNATATLLGYTWGALWMASEKGVPVSVSAPVIVAIAFVVAVGGLRCLQQVCGRIATVYTV